MSRLVAFSLIMKNGTEILWELHSELPATSLPYKGGEISFNAFPFDVISKLAGLFFALSC